MNAGNLIWIIILLAAAGFYLLKIKTSIRQKTLFLVALALICLSVATPFADFAAHGLFSAYITQQSILYLVVPPFLILGVPEEWLRPLLWHNGFKKVLQFLTYPWMTAILFNVGFSVFLLPFIFNPVHGHPLIEGLCEFVLFGFAILMWWSILSPLQEFNPLSQLQRIFYIFITAIMLTPIAFIMLFANHVLYPEYANIPDAFSYLTPMYDQQIAGGILKSFQLTAYGIELGVIILEWVRQEKEEERSKDNKVVSFKKIH
ncbi:MAG TPA: cytochrome c oxidase assembly protein [Bacillales bacterium]|nr:cytochrome c oxidase assembly protein [Bacillales bacterium]